MSSTLFHTSYENNGIHCRRGASGIAALRSACAYGEFLDRIGDASIYLEIWISGFQYVSRVLLGALGHRDYFSFDGHKLVESVTLAVIILAGGLILYAIMHSKTPVSDLLAYAQNAGFQGEDAYTAIAIALAESGGDPNAYNPETAAGAPPAEGSYGLWQIYLHAHPEFQGVNLADPQENANAAFQIYSQAGNSFRPWSTFKTGAFRKYIDTVRL